MTLAPSPSLVAGLSLSQELLDDIIGLPNST